jgi:hypothetical protein
VENLVTGESFANKPPATARSVGGGEVWGEAVLLAGDLLFSRAHFVGRICFRFTIQQPPADLASVEAGFDNYRQTVLRVRPSG